MKKEDFLKTESLIKDRARLDELIVVCSKSIGAMDEQSRDPNAMRSYAYYPTSDQLRIIYETARMSFVEQKEKILSEL